MILLSIRINSDVKLKATTSKSYILGFITDRIAKGQATFKELVTSII